MAASLRDRPRAAGNPTSDKTIPRIRKERPTPKDTEKPVKARDGQNATEVDEPDDTDLLRLCVDAETISNDFYTRTMARSMDRVYRAWRNEHAENSKYLGPGFKGRSRLFVPKTRIGVRKNMASAVSALFSTDDIANVSAVYEDDPVQMASAATKKELLNYRLSGGFTPTSINWMQLATGAMQDAQLTGVCISKQYWEYRTVEDTEDVEVDVVDDNDPTQVIGQSTIKKATQRVLIDRPMVDLIAIENAGIDPAAPWWDPIGQGRWFFARYPMGVADAKAMMRSGAKNGVQMDFLDPEKIDWTQGLVETSRQQTTRAREGGQSRFEQTIGDWELVWVVERFMRINGKDLHFWSVGNKQFISKVNPIEQVYPAFGGERPYKMGVAGVESHKVVPMSPAESWQPLQLELNDIANLRLDTLKRSIAPLAVVKRGKRVDLSVLQRRGQPEAVVQVDAQDDVQFIATPGPNGGAYTETSVTSNLFDELAGVYSTSSVANNRQLNETVGGMKLLSGAANAVSEFDLRVWVETWCEPVLRQCAKLIDYYESDANAIRMAGAKAKAWQRYAVEPTFDDLMSAEVTLRVNVGIGSADPMQRLAKMGQALGMLTPLMEQLKAEGVTPNGEAIVEEIFGLAGFKDGRRFFTIGQPPQQQQDPELMKVMEELKLKARSLDLTHEKNMLTLQQARETNNTKLQIAGNQQKHDAASQIIGHVADQMGGHVARAHDQQFQRDNLTADQAFQREGKTTDQNFQRENRQADQGFQRANKAADQNFQRENMMSDQSGGQQRPVSMEDSVNKLAALWLANANKQEQGADGGGAGGAGSPTDAGGAPQPQQPPLPSGSDMVLQAVMARLDDMSKSQQQSQAQTTAVLAQALGQLAKAIATPKQVVFNAQGRPVGVAPGAPAQAFPSAPPPLALARP